MDGFFPQMSAREANSISMLGLAHVGDAVYELLIRSMLCCQGHSSVGDLHRSTVRLVRAEAQAQAMALLLDMLDEEELAVYKRGRNTRVNSVPKHADLSQYHAATGLEALFGWLYLQGKLERINQLFHGIMENKNAT